MWSFDEFIDDRSPRSSVIEIEPSTQASNPKDENIRQSEPREGIAREHSAGQY